MEISLNLKLGLIGNAIAKSRAPSLHLFLGNLHGFKLTYDLFDPISNQNDRFIAQLKELQDQGYSGCNITYPFKQMAIESVQNCEASAQLVGATNTIKFSTETHAINTDYSGFVRAITSKLDKYEIGSTLILGAGGVGRAVAFGLASFPAGVCRIFDPSVDKALGLVDALRKHGFDAEIVWPSELEKVSQTVEGILNCSTVGHYKSPGMPINPEYIGHQKWAFDAVYTPLDTEFLKTCRQANLRIVSGFELFFYQGLDSFEFWTEQKADEKDVREAFIRESGIDASLI
ncbi:MAG: shikimate dehydrogenase family protein [Litorivicinaceae bacterium]